LWRLLADEDLVGCRGEGIVAVDDDYCRRASGRRATFLGQLATSAYAFRTVENFLTGVRASSGRLEIFGIAGECASNGRSSWAL
jgi:hypothetical protein